jgi:hypothetical protein
LFPIHNGNQIGTSQAKMGGVQTVSKSQWSGGFVDVEDPIAVEKWARQMCRGVTLDRAAAAYHTSPTLTDVVAAFGNGLPDSTRDIAKRACEEELKKANHL